VNAREHTVTNPLAGLPSVLAIRDLRRRIRRCFTGLLDPDRARGLTDRAELTERLLAELEVRRNDELDRGISLVGPHRDELLLSLGDGEQRLPVRGYASHGESWSFALALRLASYDLVRADGDDPILILDDVFAELDGRRRQRLAELVAQPSRCS